MVEFIENGVQNETLYKNILGPGNSDPTRHVCLRWRWWIHGCHAYPDSVATDRGEVVIAAYCVGSDNTATPVAVLNDASGGERNMVRCASGNAVAYCAAVK